MPQTFSVGSRSWLVTVTAGLVILWAALALSSALAPTLGASWLRALGPIGTRFGPLLPASLGPWLLALSLLLAAALFACAIGLLQRLEWARRLAIGVLALALCVQLGGLWLQHEVVTALLDAASSSVPLPAPAAGVLGGLAVATQAMGWLLTLAACVLLGWLMRRLMSPPVRQEFG